MNRSNTPLLTIFSIPKAFSGHNCIIQRNAIKSWQLLGQVEIILFGNDPGVLEIAREMNIRHFPKIETTDQGTPYLDKAFQVAIQSARGKLMMYINCDIILLSGLFEKLSKVDLSMFLLNGRRWDMTITEELDFGKGWETRLRQQIKQDGKLHGYSGIDYFIFPKNFPHDLPHFVVGRPCWDNWLIWHAKKQHIPIIDATETVTAIHQNHDYLHSKFGEKDRVGGPETKKNYVLSGGFARMLSIREADYLLTTKGLIRPPLLRSFFTWISRFQFWQLLLSFKRKMQSIYFGYDL